MSQKTAFGTFNIKSPSGQTRIARIIRMRHNEELSRQIASHLRQNNFKNIPSRSTILRILAAMPAAKAKELRGVNTTVEESRKAFQRLVNVIEEFQLLAAQGTVPGVTDESLDNLIFCVKTASQYYKSHFVYNLASESTIASHCISCACSDPSNPVYLGCKKDHDHSDTCK